VKKMEGYFQNLSKFLGDNTWIAGENITMADFVVSECIDFIRLFEPAIFAKHNVIRDRSERV
jgi:glutathione S-transferase